MEQHFMLNSDLKANNNNRNNNNNNNDNNNSNNNYNNNNNSLTSPAAALKRWLRNKSAINPHLQTLARRGK